MKFSLPFVGLIILVILFVVDISTTCVGILGILGVTNFHEFGAREILGYAFCLIVSLAIYTSIIFSRKIAEGVIRPDDTTNDVFAVLMNSLFRVALVLVSIYDFYSSFLGIGQQILFQEITIESTPETSFIGVFKATTFDEKVSILVVSFILLVGSFCLGLIVNHRKSESSTTQS